MTEINRNAKKQCLDSTPSVLSSINNDNESNISIVEAGKKTNRQVSGKSIRKEREVPASHLIKRIQNQVIKSHK